MRIMFKHRRSSLLRTVHLICLTMKATNFHSDFQLNRNFAHIYSLDSVTMRERQRKRERSREGETENVRWYYIGLQIGLFCTTIFGQYRSAIQIESCPKFKMKFISSFTMTNIIFGIFLNLITLSFHHQHFALHSY